MKERNWKRTKFEKKWGKEEAGGFQALHFLFWCNFDVRKFGTLDESNSKRLEPKYVLHSEEGYLSFELVKVCPGGIINPLFLLRLRLLALSGLPGLPSTGSGDVNRQVQGGVQVVGE